MPAMGVPFSALSGDQGGSILTSERSSTDYQKMWRMDPPTAGISASAGPPAKVDNGQPTATADTSVVSGGALTWQDSGSD